MELLRNTLKKKPFPIIYRTNSLKGTRIEETISKEVVDTTAAIGIYNTPRGKAKLDPFVFGSNLILMQYQSREIIFCFF